MSALPTIGLIPVIEWQRFNDAAAIAMKTIENNVVCLSATLGPFESSSRPYPHRRRSENGLTKALARGNAAADENPVSEDVKIARQEFRKNS
mmetsp:Transcript_19494/g.42020  ORF Transcript_19494/g.42020 Transcript_19494/m.42020 type:complete len:92 (-) Transcript_19494:327-602(-)